MDTVATNEFQDWELLHSSFDSELTPLSSLDEIGSDGLFQENYFSTDLPNRLEDVEDKSSGGSDTPSCWVDPDRFLHKVSKGILSDISISQRSLDGKNETVMSLSDNNESKQAYFDKYAEKDESLGSFWSEIEADSGEAYAFEKDSGVCVEDDVKFSEESKFIIKENDREEDQKGASEIVGDVVYSSETDMKNEGEGEAERRGGIMLWKMPMEFLKYCLFKVSPMRTVSVAAAVVGFLILGRRLNKMKNKAKRLQIKVTIDDKQVSQVMSRAARLNEAFLIVKRVPVIRPSLPAVSATTLPAVILCNVLACDLYLCECNNFPFSAFSKMLYSVMGIRKL